MPESDQKTSAASILARLRNHARAIGYPAEQMLLLHLSERFLARLAVSRWQDHLILKGGLNLYSRYRELARPTKDIDLAALRLPSTPNEIGNVIRAIALLELDDGVTFDGINLTTDSILEDAKYNGVRVWLVGGLRDSKARSTLQFDVSFGNAITPAPAILHFPNALGLVDTKVWGYPLETVMAEKLAAMIELGATTTRLKDFYDLHQIAKHGELDLFTLRNALQQTFSRRGTMLEGCVETLERLAQESRLQTDWDKFLQNNDLSAPLTLLVVIIPVIEVLIKALEY
jgi:predicted nucleotidyltransferase component of viral defense system